MIAYILGWIMKLEVRLLGRKNVILLSALEYAILIQCEIT